MIAPGVIPSGLLVIALAYLCGSIPWGLLIGRLNGLDIRAQGSGNIGATNVRRVLGRNWGIACFILDFLKGLVPVLVCGSLGGRLPIGGESARLLAAAAAVSGHVFPVWLRFRGGKGVATTIGAVLAVAPWSVLVALAAWMVLFHTTRYVSVASLSAAVMLPLGYVAARGIRGRPCWTPTLVLLLVLATLIVLRHRTNIKRLCEGTENRFERKKTT